jgi:hypothetical protein
MRVLKLSFFGQGTIMDGIIALGRECGRVSLIIRNLISIVLSVKQKMQLRCVLVERSSN